MENGVIRLPVVRPVCTFCEKEPSNPKYDGEFKVEGRAVHFCTDCARELAAERMEFVKAA